MYDANNDWLLNENWADGNSTSYAYNAIGQRTSATDANGTFTYSYDNRDRLTREAKHDGSELLYGYDDAGNRTTLSTVVAGVTNTATYTFDALNRMTSVADNDGNTTTYEFDANSNQTGIDQANGTATTMVFDELNRVTTITHLGTAGETLTSLTYTLDDTGRRTAITESSGRTSDYTYDALYRLTGDTITDSEVGSHSASYTYNEVSNRSGDTVNGVSSTYTFDDNDRLTNHGFDTYSYDDNGNTLSEVVDGQSNSYSYDSQNRLRQANRGGVVQAMAYDPDGVRIQKEVGGSTTDYLTDSNRDYAQVLYERSATGELNYTFGMDLVGLDAGTEQFTYHTDALGSTRLLTNDAGVVADEVRYDAWGEQLAGGDVVENQYLYTGEQFDSGLGKTYLRARYYDAGVGRFSQMDVWPGQDQEPISLNKFMYANGDPADFTDPTGLFSLGSTLSTLNTASNLLTVASTTLDTLGLSGGESMNENDSSESLWDILMAYVISGVNSSIGTESVNGGIAALAAVTSSGEKHHTIPIYVCGHKSQKISALNRSTHRELHRQLYSYSVAVNVAGKSIDLLFKRPQSRSKRTPIQRLARTKIGKTAIAKGLSKFYTEYDYWGSGSPSVAAVFAIEAPRFEKGHSSYKKKCQR